MNKRNLIWLCTAVMLLALVGCSKKEETTSETPTENPSAPVATPIDQSTVGSVTGKVSFDGAKPKQQRIMMDQDPVCVQKHGGKPVFAEDGEVNDNGTLPNAFVYVKTGAEKYTFAPPSTPVTLDQDGCMYKPHVLGVMAGQTLKHCFQRRHHAQHSSHAQGQPRVEHVTGARRRAHRAEVRAAGNHGSGKVQPAPLDARVDRRYVQPVLRGVG